MFKMCKHDLWVSRYGHPMQQIIFPAVRSTSFWWSFLQKMPVFSKIRSKLRFFDNLRHSVCVSMASLGPAEVTLCIRKFFASTVVPHIVCHFEIFGFFSNGYSKNQSLKNPEQPNCVSAASNGYKEAALCFRFTFTLPAVPHLVCVCETSMSFCRKYGRRQPCLLVHAASPLTWETRNYYAIPSWTERTLPKPTPDASVSYGDTCRRLRRYLP